MLSWKIAWRNIWRHKGKSLVIGTILFLGALLMTVGNSIIDGAREGMEINMISRFTGHLVIKPNNQKDDEVFSGGPMGGGLKLISDYPEIKELLNQQEEVLTYVPMMRGMAGVLNPDGDQGILFGYGVNFDKYQETFLNNVLLSEGQLLDNAEKGIIITQRVREWLFEQTGLWVVPQGVTKEETPLYADPKDYKELGVNDPKVMANAKKKEAAGRLKTIDEMIVLGYGSSSFGNDIRVPVKGVFKFKNLNKVWQEVAFMDIESFRDAFGYNTASQQTVELSNEQQEIMDSDLENMDDMFGGGDLIESSDVSDETFDLSALKVESKEVVAPVDIDQGVYNFVAVKLKDGIELADGQKRLQKVFDDAGIPVTVIDWEKSIGTIAQFMSIGQTALSIFVLFIFFVAIIVIMNTLSMAAMERVTEIGMMRAVGAQKWFISKMFLMETFSLSFVFGGAGVIIGVILSVFLASLGIPVTSSELLSLMFASDTFNPIITGSTLISGIIELFIVTILAVVYPLFIARKITPLEAIARD